jgi:hypothetical protein
MNLRRDHHARTYMIRVCPYHGHTNVGCCDRETIVVETAPMQRVIELRDALDQLKAEHRLLQGTRQVVFNIKGASLFGSREAVATANAAIAELKAKAAA